MNVSKTLIKWYHLNHRELPWRSSTDPYIIWLSEIILQQTRVEQGLPYFLRFVDKYPTISDLANAPEEEVLKIWQGLGYYSRARNLHATSKFVHQHYQGIFPSEYDQILALKGIGDYTAAAIASFAYNQPFAVVDGNVFRVLSRLFGESTPIDTTTGKKLFTELANDLLNKKTPGIHNQAIMEFGATLCRPSSPDCHICPLNGQCIALREGKIGILPVKAKKTKVSKRYFNYLLVRHKKGIYINKRKQGDIWEMLYELPLIETELLENPEILMRSAIWKSYFTKKQLFLKSVKSYPVYKLSHQHIFARLFEMEITGEPEPLFANSFIKINESDAGNYPVPRLIERIFSDHLG